MSVSTGKPRILLGHLVSNGDCLYATAIARQIKADFPGCHLTWAIGEPCRALLQGNPYVDKVWEIPFAHEPQLTAPEIWRRFRVEAETRRARGQFDHAFYTQILPDHAHLYDGMIRSTTFRGYPYPVTVPVTPVLRLTSEETERVRHYAKMAGLPGCASVVLFECAPRSGQSTITPEIALALANEIVTGLPNARVILSSSVALTTNHPRIFDASSLSLRENAELTRYCTLLIGCSSGITWIATSEAAKRLPMIQLLNKHAVWFNSVLRDFHRWKLPSETVIEIEDSHAARVPACVQAMFTEGFTTARTRFHEHIPRNFETYGAFQRDFLRRGQWHRAWTLLCVNVAEHGPHPALLGCHLRWIMRYLRQRFFPRRVAPFPT